MDAVTSGYLLALDGVTFDALKATAGAVIRGELEEMSAKACPTASELSRAVRGRMADDRRRELIGQAVAYTPTPFLSIEARLDATRQRYADEDRSLLFTVGSHSEARSRARECPPGSVYSGMLGAFYGPPGYYPLTGGAHHEDRCDTDEDKRHERAEEFPAGADD